MDGNTQLSREPRAIALAGPISAPLRPRCAAPPNMYYVGEGAGEKSGGLVGFEKVEKKAEFGIPNL